MDRRAGAQVDAVPVHLPRDLLRVSAAPRIRPGDARGQRLSCAVDGDQAVHGGAEAYAADVPGVDPTSPQRGAYGGNARRVDLLRILLGYSRGRHVQGIAGGVAASHL